MEFGATSYQDDSGTLQGCNTERKTHTYSVKLRQFENMISVFHCATYGKMLSRRDKNDQDYVFTDLSE